MPVACFGPSSDSANSRAPSTAKARVQPPGTDGYSSPPAAALPVARPFLKWAGGKRQLLPHLQAALPPRFNRYFEPFLGGGALFFRLAPAQAELSDINRELIDTYRAIKANVEAVIAGLSSLKNDEQTFYALRAIAPASLSLAARAARFIYLNRTCFNGLYRVNQRGLFNAPFGRYLRPNVCDAVNLRAVAKCLQRPKLAVRSFAAVASRARPGDLVYFDPPYVPLSATANFVQYTRGGFGLREQRKLAALFFALASRGVHVMLSNSDTPLVRSLYSGFGQIALQARRNINCLGTHRGLTAELLVVAHAKTPSRPRPAAALATGGKR